MFYLITATTCNLDFQYYSETTKRELKVIGRCNHVVKYQPLYWQIPYMNATAKSHTLLLQRNGHANLHTGCVSI